MIARLLTMLAVLLLCFPSVFSGQEFPQDEKPNQVFFTDIRHVPFKNSTFKRRKGDETIRLRDGISIRASDHHYSLMRIAYGDLIGHGSEAAIVLLRGQNSRLSLTLDEVFIYEFKAGQPVFLTSFEGGRRGEYILSVESLGSNFRVEHQSLIIDQAVYTNDREYMPTHYYTIKYRWDGRQILEVERSSLKPLPESMREIG
jgi:hypothetical protein